jgi:hypothetical protein
MVIARSKHARIVRSIIVAASAIALSVTTFTTPSHAAVNDRGLYGEPNQFASVQLQSKAILGLLSARVVPSKNAVNWLLRQQCANGSFQGYRANTSTPCSTSDAATFSGPSADQTAWALMALEAAGQEAAATKAARWLVSVAKTDSNGRLGIPSYANGTPDANATGITLAALRGLGYSPATSRQLQRYLGSLIIPCSEARGGASVYQSSVPGANNSASAQSFFGITATLPTFTPDDYGSSPKCGKNAAIKLGSYLNKQIAPSGLLDYYPYEGNSFGDTALALIGFTSQGISNKAVTQATAALKANSRSWALPEGKPNAGALGSLLMVSIATGSNPKNFGGINLVAEINKSETK